MSTINTTTNLNLNSPFSKVFDSINKENEPQPITSKPAASITNSGAPLSEKSTNPIEKSVTIKSEPQKVITKPSQHPRFLLF